MMQIIQLAYIVTIMVGVIPFAMQTMISIKNLSVNNDMVKSRNTGVFLALIVVFNMCDFLIVFLRYEIGPDNVEWIYILENVLEVALAYFLIAMERDYAGEKKSSWIIVFFMSVATVILWTDTLYTTDLIWMSEKVYMMLMTFLNILPLGADAYFSVKYMHKIMRKTESRIVDAYLIIYNIVFIFLCIVVTMSIIDSRTTWDYFKNDKEIYLIFWLIFNILNAVFVMNSCRIVSDEETPETIEMRLDKIASEKGLSSREQEIAMLLYQGKNNNEIADALFLSTNTVQVHASNLYRKLGVSNRVQAVRLIRGEAAGGDSEEHEKTKGA